MSLNLGIALALFIAIFGAISGAYIKGERNCASSYEVKILKAKLKNQEIALSYYKSGEANAKKLAEEALAANAKLDKTGSEQLREIDVKPIASAQCIDNEFLQSVERIR